MDVGGSSQPILSSFIAFTWRNWRKQQNPWSDRPWLYL